MKLCRALCLLVSCVLLTSVLALGQRNSQGRPPAAASPSPAADQAGKPGAPPPEPKKEAPEQPPVVTHHEIHVGGKLLRYTATAGMMPLKNNDTGEVEARIFYIAY